MAGIKVHCNNIIKFCLKTAKTAVFAQKKVSGCKVSPLIWSIFIGQNADLTSGRDCTSQNVLLHQLHQISCQSDSGLRNSAYCAYFSSKRRENALPVADDFLAFSCFENVAGGHVVSLLIGGKDTCPIPDPVSQSVSQSASYSREGEGHIHTHVRCVCNVVMPLLSYLRVPCSKARE